MSLTISDYKNWAAENQRSTVALNDESTGLVKESSRIGRVKRMLSRGTVNEMRGAVMKDFTRAFSSRYGATIAQQAISAAGLTSKSELKGWKIARAISAAKNIRAQMLQPAEGQALRLGNTEVSANTIAGYLGDKNNAVTKFLKERAVAVQLLEVGFGEPPEDFRVGALGVVASEEDHNYLCLSANSLSMSSTVTPMDSIRTRRWYTRSEVS